jgi:hypothetical protein
MYSIVLCFLTQGVALLERLLGGPGVVAVAAGVPGAVASHGVVRRGGELHRQSNHDGEDGGLGHCDNLIFFFLLD